MRPVALQAPSKHQVLTHSVLGVPMHKIVCRTKRIGGGFGGKETRSAFIQARIRSQMLSNDWFPTSCFATGCQHA
jgi:xanthine dehydrogenase molybdopterin-binding subunit B